MENEIKPENNQIDNKLLAEQNDLLRRNLEMSQTILEKTDKIKTYMKWQQVWGFIRFILIAIPIAIGFIYLPPLIKTYLEQFTSLYK